MCQNYTYTGSTPMRYTKRPDFFNLNHIQAVKLVDFIPPYDDDGSDLVWVRVFNVDGSNHVPYWVKRWLKQHVTNVVTDYDLSDADNSLGFDVDRITELMPDTGGVAVVADDDYEHLVFPGDYLVSLKNRNHGFTTFVMPEAIFDKMYVNNLELESDDDDTDTVVVSFNDDSVDGLDESDETDANSLDDAPVDVIQAPVDAPVDVIHAPVDVIQAPTRDELSQLSDKFDNDALYKVALTAPTKTAIAEFVGYSRTTVSDWIKKTKHQDVRQRFGLA